MASDLVNFCKKCQIRIYVCDDSYLKCNICAEFVHIKCIPSNLIDSGIAGDIFFLYTCSECSSSGDVLVRDKISWFNAIVLALYDMSCKCSGISNQGYFHWKTHIISFIDRNWQTLFSSNLKRKRNWLGTIAGILSHNSPSFFLSGASDLGDTGWWKLSHDLLPGVYVKLYNDVISVRNKVRIKHKNKPSLMMQDEVIVLQLLKDYGLKLQHEAFENNLKCLRKISDNESSNENENNSSSEDVPPKKMHLDNEENIYMNNTGFSETVLKNDFISTFGNFDIDIDDSNVNAILKSEDIFDFNFSFDDFMPNLDVNNDALLSDSSNSTSKIEIKLDTTEYLPIKSLFDVNNKPRVKPWDNSIIENSDKDILQPLSEYQEHEIHKKLKQYLEIVDNNFNLLLTIDANKLCEARRLYRKLSVRKHLRKRNIEFNLDKLANGENSEHTNIKLKCELNVLDKFQVVSTPDIANTSFATRLTGISVWNCFVSPYTNRTLKPFIRRDYETIPPWRKLMNQIVMKVSRKPSKRAPIGYCYVRPHHIAAINSLCEQFYWPGIDVS